MKKCPINATHSVKHVKFNTFEYDFCEECKETIKFLSENTSPPPIPHDILNASKNMGFTRKLEDEANEGLIAGGYPYIIRIDHFSLEQISFKLFDKISKKMVKYSELDKTAKEDIDMVLDFLLRKYKNDIKNQ